MKAIERQIAEIDTYTDCDDGHVFRTWRDTMQALLDDWLKMRDGIDAIYNYSDEAREAVIECYGLHHNLAIDKLKEVCPDE